MATEDVIAQNPQNEVGTANEQAVQKALDIIMQKLHDLDRRLKSLEERENGIDNGVVEIKAFREGRAKKCFDDFIAHPDVDAVKSRIREQLMQCKSKSERCYVIGCAVEAGLVMKGDLCPATQEEFHEFDFGSRQTFSSHRWDSEDFRDKNRRGKFEHIYQAFSRLNE